MNTNTLSLSNFKTTFLGKLPNELLEIVFPDTTNLGIMGRHRQVCKALKVFIDEKKLFERILSTDAPAVEKLLKKFYSISPWPQVPYTYSLYCSVKSGVRYSYMLKILGDNRLEKGKILFINGLDKEFREACHYETSFSDLVLAKLLLFVDDPSQKVSTQARRLSKQLIIDVDAPSGGVSLSWEQKSWIKEACEQIDIRRGILRILILSIGSLAGDYIMGSVGVLMFYYYMGIFLYPLGLYMAIEAISKYIRYGHLDASDKAGIVTSAILSLAFYIRYGHLDVSGQVGIALVLGFIRSLLF